MVSQHFIGTVAQKAIIERNGEILLCRGKGDTIWELPGGRLHDDESPQEGLVREIQEELSLTVTVGLPVYIARAFHGQDRQWMLFIAYSCTLSDNKPPQPDQTEIEEVKWVRIEDLPSIQLFDEYQEALNVYTSKR